MNTDILARREATTSAALVPVFAATLFLSAGLMFLVEPMIAKMVLPRLGGSPAVWSTCLVFFQAMLLLGYLYAHLLSRAVKRPVQMGVHLLIVLPAAAVSLPLSLGAAVPPPDGWPPLWLLLHLAISVGAPAFALSATAPLLQSWFAGLDHKSAGTRIFCMRPAMPAACWRCWPIRLPWSLPFGSTSRPRCGRGVSACWRPASR